MLEISSNTSDLILIIQKYKIYPHLKIRWPAFVLGYSKNFTVRQIMNEFHAICYVNY